MERKSGVTEFTAEALDCGREVGGDTVEKLGNPDGDIVAVGECRAVSFVPVEQDNDARNLAILREHFVESIEIDWVDYPDALRCVEGVTRSLHRLLGVCNPADTTIEPVDLLSLAFLIGGFQCHMLDTHARHKRTTTENVQTIIGWQRVVTAMLGDLGWLALEVKYLDRAQSFYESFLDLDTLEQTDAAAVLDAGDPALILRTPSTVPRGGLHTHYAFSIPSTAYDRWYDRLDERFDLVEHSFGGQQSLYFYDPDGNCVELGQSAVDGPGIDGIFEIVFEVETLTQSRSFYERLGFEPVDVGESRTRIRLTSGAFDIELWEPHLGLADARGGVHVDVGMEATDPAEIADAVRDDALAVSDIEAGYRIRDPDGHYLSIIDS